MGTLTLRIADEALARDLEERALWQRRSVEEEVLFLLRRGLRSARLEPFSPEKRIARARAISALTPRVPQMDSVELLREERDL